MSFMTTDSKYSDKYRLLDQERVNERTQRTTVARERAKLLSQATNKRRRAIEEKRSKEEKLEEERREAILAQRREWQNQATIRFQRAHLPPEKRHFKYSRMRPRTPPRSISVEDALRTIQTQKYERASSFPRQNTRSPDYHGPENAIKDENNNASSPYAQAQYIPSYHQYTRPTSEFSLRSHNSFSGTPDFSEQHGKLHDQKISTNIVSPQGSSRSNSAQTTLARDKLKIITETYNIQPFQPPFKNKRPESASNNSTTTTIIALDSSGNGKTQLPFNTKPLQPSAKYTNGTTDAARDILPRDVNQHNSGTLKNKSAVSTRSAFGGGDSAHSSHGAKSVFEKQLEIQQKKLLEMQQKTVEDFQKALNENGNGHVMDVYKNGPFKQSDGETIAKDSLDGESDSSDDEVGVAKAENEQKQTILHPQHSRPANPEPLDFDNTTPKSQIKDKTESLSSDGAMIKQTAQPVPKFRTPQSTITISAEQAKSIIHPQNSTNQASEESAKPAKNEKTYSQLNKGKVEASESTREPAALSSAKPPVATPVKRKPLPMNSANTVAKAIETKTVTQEELSDHVNSGPVEPVETILSHKEAPIPNGQVRALKQEPGPTAVAQNVNNGTATAKTPLQYIAYTPIRKWDSPGSTSPKPVAEVAPVPSTPPKKESFESEPPIKQANHEMQLQNGGFENDVAAQNDLKHSAKMYMNGISYASLPHSTATVAHVIDPQWSIYNNSQKSTSSLESSSGSNLDKTSPQIYGVQPNSSPNAQNLGFQGSQWNQNHVAEVSETPVVQKSLIPVPIGKENAAQTKPSEEPRKTGGTNYQQTGNISDEATSKPVQQQRSLEERRGSDGSVGSQKSRPEIRSSSPFDRLVDGSNADDIEELEAEEETLQRPKSILKRTASLENCSQISVRDSLDISNSRRMAKTPTPVVHQRAASAKRSVRFAETVQVQSKDEIDERLPRSQARAVSARGARVVSESPDGRKPPLRSAPLKPPSSHNVPGEIEEIRYTQQSRTSSNEAEQDYHLNKTPTDEEINALWESIRENMNVRRKGGSVTGSDSGVSNHKPAVYISNSAAGYYNHNHFIKQTNGPPAVASQYIDGSSLFADQNLQNSNSSNVQAARPVSAASIPRKQHLLGQRQQQSTVKSISQNTTSSKSAHMIGSATGQSPSSNTAAPMNSPNGNSYTFPGVPKASTSAPLNSQQARNKQTASDPVSASLAQFLAAEDLSNMSLNEGQIEDILHQLQSRKNITQLSLEEQKLLMSLEHLNNKLKLTEARFKGQR